MFNPTDYKCSLVYPNYVEFVAKGTEQATETDCSKSGQFRIIFESSLPVNNKKYVLQFSLYNVDKDTEQLYNIIVPDSQSLCVNSCVITSIITDKVYTTVLFTKLNECDKYILTSCLDYI